MMKKILVVDDSVEIRELLEMIFTRLGHELFLTRSGQEALKLLATQKVDLIISDLDMEDGDGYWLINELAINNHTAKIIVLTGDLVIKKDLLKEQGVLACFSKPFSMNEFLNFALSVL